MGTLKEYQCNGCGYTITGTRKGRTLVMSGEIETEKVPRRSCLEKSKRKRFRGNALSAEVT